MITLDEHDLLTDHFATENPVVLIEAPENLHGHFVEH